jgi:hypothetical protein
MIFDGALALNTILPLAQAAYDAPLVPPGWKIVAKIEPGDFGFVVMGVAVSDIPGLGRVCALTFAGTRTGAEWLRDFDFRPVPNLYGSGHIARGFQNQYSLIRTSMFAGVVECDELWVIGHSLGAALAYQAAAELAPRYKHIPVCTFEGPRTGWFDWAHWFDTLVPSCWRIVNKWDLVPHQPNAIAGFLHVGTEIEVDGGFTHDIHVAHALAPAVKTGLEAYVLQHPPPKPL